MTLNGGRIRPYLKIGIQRIRVQMNLGWYLHKKGNRSSEDGR